MQRAGNRRDDYPNGITHSMAAAAVTLVLAAAHRLRQRDLALRAGDWGTGRFLPHGAGLRRRTLGVIGYGRIGREVVRLLEPWEMRVVVTQRTPVTESGVTYAALDELLAESDVVVVACPLTDATRGLLDAPRLGLMKSTAVLVNVARGAIVDQAALVDALAQRAPGRRRVWTWSTRSRYRPTIPFSGCRTSSERRILSVTPTT